MGFQFANVSFDFPAKSYAQLEPFGDLTGFITESEQRYNANKDAFAAVMKKLTVDDTHKFTWQNITSQDYNSSFASFPNVNCDTLNKTVFSYLNSIKKEGENVTMPRLDLNLNEYNISIGYDTLFEQKSNTC